MTAITFTNAYLHELFGFDEPIQGFEDPIQIPAEKSPFVPDIDPGYVFTPDLVRRVLLSVGARENVMLVGDKGTGKTSFVQQFCGRLNLPLMSITGGPGLDETYLMGSKTIENGSVKSVDGILSYCLRHGICVLVDELANINPRVLVSINDVLNGDKRITLKHHGIDPELLPVELASLQGSMTINRHPMFRFFATDNTGGKKTGDPRYAGIMVQNTAVRSRFTNFKVGFMPADKELKALRQVTGDLMDVGTAAQIVELAVRVRKAFQQGEMEDTLSFRELKRWACKALAYGQRQTLTTPDFKDKTVIMPCITTSFVDAVYAAMEEEDQEVVQELFHLTFGYALELPSEYDESFEMDLQLLKKAVTEQM